MFPRLLARHGEQPRAMPVRCPPAVNAVALTSQALVTSCVLRTDPVRFTKRSVLAGKSKCKHTIEHMTSINDERTTI
jgi:hypothetical protein